MLDIVTRDMFFPHLDKKWVLEDGGGGYLELTLVKADPMHRTKIALVQRMPFLLIFRGPSDKIANEGTYNLSHPIVGTIEGVNVVPTMDLMDPDYPGARYYQVIFC
ncbi:MULTISPECIES: hypothetical protein [unclassified Azospirillum]|jgi:hypothetical protein|uniref:DUF6916 family protein n=1 Tax=unclassified Azospirillum TaxID=2630922 RepID=UPI000B659F19|nr:MULTISPECIES: hypothetical protein [unclassified Azospirillum]SNT18142.1 hypothetical protein SAMN05880556_1305 [Azospirillum sp. RU38E]SNT30176.1 hypothetical protein SAMN05880591_1305 [Azospirillum sp. RU37A]